MVISVLVTAADWRARLLALMEEEVRERLGRDDEDISGWFGAFRLAAIHIHQRCP